MKRRILTLTIFVLSLGLMFSGAAFAEDQNGAKPEGDSFIMVEQDENPGEVVNRIKLPEVPAQEGRINSKDGIDTAKEAREDKREFGMERAQEARQNEIREEVRERNRENILDRMPEQDTIRDRAREHMPSVE